MSNSPVVAVFAEAVRETREDLREVGDRLLARVGDLTARASGVVAGQVDELGATLSARVDVALGRLASRVGDGVVGLGERLTRAGRPGGPDTVAAPES